MGSYARFEHYLTTLKAETCPEFLPPSPVSGPLCAILVPGAAGRRAIPSFGTFLFICRFGTQPRRVSLGHRPGVLVCVRAPRSAARSRLAYGQTYIVPYRVACVRPFSAALCGAVRRWTSQDFRSAPCCCALFRVSLHRPSLPLLEGAACRESVQQQTQWFRADRAFACLSRRRLSVARPTSAHKIAAYQFVFD